MLKNIKEDTYILFLLVLIFINYLLFLSPSLEIIIKLNFIFYLLLIVVFFYRLKNNFLMFFLIFLILISLGSPLDQWDARSIWLFKAKRIFFDGTITSVKDNYAQFGHPGYPNIGPAFAAGLAKTIGNWNEIFPKIGLTLIFFPMFMILNTFFRNNLFLLIITITLFIIGKFLINGELDGLVAMYFTVSSLLVYSTIFIDKHKYNYLLITLCLIILSLLKQEGFILVIIISLISILFSFINKDIDYKLILSFLIAIIPALIWHKFTSDFNITNSDSAYGYNLINLIDRMLILENYELILKYLIFNDKFLFGFVFFSISAFVFRNKFIFFYVFSICLGYLLVLMIVYLSTPLDLQWHLNSSASRVIKSIAFFLSIFSVYSISIKKN